MKSILLWFVSFCMLLQTDIVFAETDTNSVLLHREAYEKNFANVKQFVSAGVDIESRDSMGRTVLMTALKPQSNVPKAEIVRLIANNEDILSEEVLLGAVGGGNGEIVRFLIAQGADVSARDSRKQTPLHIAARNNMSAEVLQLLIDKGAKIEALTEHGNTPLHMASVNPVATRVLLKAGANIEAKDTHGNTPLYMASVFVVNMRVLIEAGANVNVQNGNGNTPLHIACEKAYLAEVKYLIDSGADPLIRNRQGKRAIDSQRVKNDKKMHDYLSTVMAQ